MGQDVKVTLIVPPSGFMLDERVYPMLGVLKVAAVLKTAGHYVDVLDLSGPGQEAALYWHANRGPSDVYGITATMPQMPEAARIASRIRAMFKTRIILGGAHVTMVNTAARAGVARSQQMLDALSQEFDSVVAGDGEHAVFEAIKPDAPFLIDADKPGTALFLTPQQVADSPWAARDMIDLHSYHCWVGGLPATSMIAQLGCPFRCGFCGGRNSPTFRRLRSRPAEDVVNEMCDIEDRWGYKGFMFLDDELNVNKAYPDLLRRMIAVQKERGTEWRMSGLLKSELFTTEQAELMYEAGFRKVLIGFESAHPRILENMQKNATVEDNTRAVETARKAGIRVKALMSLGHPGESEETIKATKDWLLAVKPDEFDATVLTIYPGTPYHDEALETSSPGLWLYQSKKHFDSLYFREIDQFTDTPYYKGIPGEYQAFVFTEHLDSPDLVRLRDDLETSVRETLNIPWPTTAAENNYEHSMGLHS